MSKHYKFRKFNLKKKAKKPPVFKPLDLNPWQEGHLRLLLQGKDISMEMPRGGGKTTMQKKLKEMDEGMAKCPVCGSGTWIYEKISSDTIYHACRADGCNWREPCGELEVNPKEWKP